MTQVKLDKSLAEDLITSKLRILKQYTIASHRGSKAAPSTIRT